MNGLDHLGLGQAKQVMEAFEVAGRILKSVSAVGGFIELALLGHGPHRAVDNDNAFLEKFLQLLHAVRAAICVGDHRSGVTAMDPASAPTPGPQFSGAASRLQPKKSTYLDGKICSLRREPDSCALA